MFTEHTCLFFQKRTSSWYVLEATKDMSQVQQLPGALQDVLGAPLITEQLRTAALGVFAAFPAGGIGSAW